MMRFNQKELAFIATRTDIPFDKEGVLWLKEKEGYFWSRNEGNCEICIVPQCSNSALERTFPNTFLSSESSELACFVQGEIGIFISVTHGLCRLLCCNIQKC